MQQETISSTVNDAGPLNPSHRKGNRKTMMNHLVYLRLRPRLKNRTNSARKWIVPFERIND